MVSPVLLSKEMEEKLATSLTANVFSLLQYMNSLPSALPQRSHLPNILFVSLPSQALHFVYIFPLNLAPSPANCSSRAESSKEDGCQAWHRIWSLCAPQHAQGFPPRPLQILGETHARWHWGFLLPCPHHCHHLYSNFPPSASQAHQLHGRALLGRKKAQKTKTKQKALLIKLALLKLIHFPNIFQGGIFQR